MANQISLPLYEKISPQNNLKSALKPYHLLPPPLPSILSYVELPPEDMFVTTADHVLEPPILTMNTIISLLAIDYPAHKLTCYVLNDGSSPLTFYSLVETSKFAELWVPFCKRFRFQIRAPFKYIFGEPILSDDNSL
ncbi:Cellulose synthase [Dillenia turbinata]|uniref:Cellulose synthase n=1 Tax=Dillenia turbinata TaxID=194707 RepID=A0AAN8YZS1_9MAGN